MAGDRQGTQEIVDAIVADLGERDLRAGDDDGLGEILEHERQGRSRVAHGVGAMQHHERIVVVVAGVDVGRDALPVRLGRGKS